METDDQPLTLEKILHCRISAWLALQAPRVRSDVDYASIKITIHQPQGDDDGTLFLEFLIEEESGFESDGAGGRVPGLRL